MISYCLVQIRSHNVPIVKQFAFIKFCLHFLNHICILGNFLECSQQYYYGPQHYYWVFLLKELIKRNKFLINFVQYFIAKKYPNPYLLFSIQVLWRFHWKLLFSFCYTLSLSRFFLLSERFYSPNSFFNVLWLFLLTRSMSSQNPPFYFNFIFFEKQTFQHLNRKVTFQ